MMERPELPTPLPATTVTRTSGLDIVAGDLQTPPTDRRVRWLRASDGVPVAELYGFQINNAQKFTGLYGDARSPDGTYAECRLAGLAGADGDGAALFYVQHLRGNAAATRIFASVDGAAGGANPIDRTLIDAAGQSSFLQLVGALAKREAAFGTSTLHWPIALGAKSEQLTVAHGLGTTPTQVLPTVVGVGVEPVIACHVANIGAVNFDVVGEYVGGLKVTDINRNVSWAVFA